MTTEREWEEMFRGCGAYWLHDGHPERPYARLTSGLISNGFFNGGRVAEDGHLFGLACTALWRKADGAGITGKNLRVAGAEKGGISLSSRIAEAGHCFSAYAEKMGDDLIFLRPNIRDEEEFLLVEDTITTGGTIKKLYAAVASLRPDTLVRIKRVVLALCNRSGKTHIEGLQIIALISPTFTEWKEGENPFTPDGKELVPPVRPKANWHDLTREY
jgi:orotate phosphoribosyltransferase